VETLTHLVAYTPSGCASGCTWLLQSVKICISTDMNVHNLYYYMYNINLNIWMSDSF
jgi:hypothetical protein